MTKIEEKTTNHTRTYAPCIMVCHFFIYIRTDQLNVNLLEIQRLVDLY